MNELRTRSNSTRNYFKSDLPALINELGEIGIDSLVNDGVFKDIPVLSSVLAIGKTFGNVRDYFFSKRIIKFLQELSSMSNQERTLLIQKVRRRFKTCN